MILIMGFAKAYLFGLTLALSVGPMTLLLIQRGVTKGSSSALATAFALALADFTYALIFFSIGASVLRFTQVHDAYVYLFSGIILLLLAMYVFYSALQKYIHQQRVVAAKGVGSDFLSAYILTMHNPMTVIIFLGFLGYLTEAQSALRIMGFALALFLGSLSGQLVFGCTACSLRGFFQNPKSIFILNAISAIGIAVFAIVSFLKVFWQ